MRKKYTVKYVKQIDDKGYPVHTQGYAQAHKKANEAEHKLDPKMYAKENRVERKLKPRTLMATHDKRGNIKIERQYKPFTKTLKKHERTEWEHDKGKKKGSSK